MTFLDAIVLGIIEGLTEFLPVSSTGHLILAGQVLGIPEDDFLKTFMIAIQLGAILAVVALYWRSLLNIEVLKRLAVAFVPTAAVGLLFYNVIKSNFLENQALVVATLFFGGIALIVFELWHKEEEVAEDSPEKVSYKQALLIGVFQSIAIVPGVSRSAATIVGGLLAGLRRVTIVEFSFLLAVPTMAAATGLDILKNYDTILSGGVSLMLLGFVTAFIVALFAMRFLLSFVKTYSFIPFGVYRIVVAVLFFCIVL